MSRVAHPPSTHFCALSGSCSGGIGSRRSTRETVESAYLMGAEGLRALGFAELEIEEAAADIRQRDTERLSEQVQGDIMSGRDRLHTQPIPEPFGSASVARRQQSELE